MSQIQTVRQAFDEYNRHASFMNHESRVRRFKMFTAYVPADTPIETVDLQTSFTKALAEQEDEPGIRAAWKLMRRVFSTTYKPWEHNAEFQDRICGLSLSDVEKRILWVMMQHADTNDVVSMGVRQISYAIHMKTSSVSDTIKTMAERRTPRLLECMGKSSYRPNGIGGSRPIQCSPLVYRILWPYARPKKAEATAPIDTAHPAVPNTASVDEKTGKTLQAMEIDACELLCLTNACMKKFGDPSMDLIRAAGSMMTCSTDLIGDQGWGALDSIRRRLYRHYARYCEYVASHPICRESLDMLLAAGRYMTRLQELLREADA